jgi:hypothetical protein
MSLAPKDPLFRYPIDNTKFWLWEAEEGEGWTVGSGDHELAFRLPESTARLIASAPELLAALKAHIPWKQAGQPEKPPHGWGIWQDAIDAINKAEGRAE